MTSYWKLINMLTSEMIAVGKEDQIYELKMLYENKMNTPTKMIKCFGDEKFKKDKECMRQKALKLLNATNKCYNDSF